jgi:parallel beta-helix repeat protein
VLGGAAALLISLGSATVVANLPASAADCPINVASYGHTLGAAQKALKQVSGTCRTIEFPAGTYVFADQFRITVDSVTVTGKPGAVIRAASGASFRGGLLQLGSGASGITVRGLTIVNSPDKGLELWKARNFTVSGNIIYGSRKMGIHVLRSTSGTLSNNTVYRNRSNGIDLHGSTGITIRNNKVYLNGGPRWPDRNEGDGILIYCSQHVNVLSNTTWNNGQSQPGSRDGIRLSDNRQQDGEMPTRYVTIDGNASYDTQSEGTQGWAIRIGHPASGRLGGDINYVKVTNNTGYGNLNAGIYTKGLAPGATYVYSNNKLTGE